MAAFGPFTDTTGVTWTTPTYVSTNTMSTATWFTNQTRATEAKAAVWKTVRERDRAHLARVGAGQRAGLHVAGPRRYLTTAARAPGVRAACPLRGAREFAYKRPRKTGRVPL